MIGRTKKLLCEILPAVVIWGKLESLLQGSINELCAVHQGDDFLMIIKSYPLFLNRFCEFEQHGNFELFSAG